MQLFRGADEILTLAGAAAKQGRRVLEGDLGILKNASLLIHRGRLAWVGELRKLPREFHNKIEKEWNCRGRVLLPGLVECHTHTVFAGDRSEEFEWRLRGQSYQEIYAKGGGILSTLRKTRQASAHELFVLAKQRTQRFVAQGVTCLEVKSGYGLNLKDEIKCLKVAQKLAQEKKGPRIVSTFLGAHGLPPEFDDHDVYLQYLLEDVLPKIKKQKLADRIDIFVESGFFSVAGAHRYLQAAKNLGFQIVVHADQLTLSGGTSLATELGALSADHVIQVQKKEISQLAASNTTAVLLPAADLYMRCSYPPARQMIDAGVRVALATDFNPGSSPTQDVSLVGLLARLEMKMTLPEVFVAYTIGAAAALGCSDIVGSLEVGKGADFISTTEGWQMFFYQAGWFPRADVFLSGKQVYSSKN